MKKLLLFIVPLFSMAILQAQVCTPDPIYTSPGIYPDSATGLPVTYDNLPSYNTVITVVVPEDTTVGFLTLHYEWIHLDSIVGLPVGFTYACPSACYFPGNTASCIRLTGNPSVTGDGTYPFTAYVTAKLTNFLLGTIYESQVIDDYKIQIEHVPVVCGTPTGLASGSITSTSATVSWDNMGASYYKVKYRPSTGGAWTTVSTTSTSYNLTGLISCAQYKWSVTAVCPGTGSFKSATKKFTTNGLDCREAGFSDAAADRLIINPNPVTDVVYVNYISPYAGEQKIFISDMQGKIVLETQAGMFEGANNFNIDVSSLTSGMYIMKIFGGEGEYVAKFMKD
ncbi:MAG: T9SS type A sorting domain-containing protein [Chitinophagales bacterium]|nr:T9SS type A sorting domain-containing protein [Chitinophagales bacterium]